MGEFYDFTEANPWVLWLLGVSSALFLARAAIRYFYAGDGWMSSLAVGALQAAVLLYHLLRRRA
jgi:hypothetical protein